MKEAAVPRRGDYTSHYYVMKQTTFCSVRVRVF
jgi:hypothetical protein